MSGMQISDAVEYRMQRTNYVFHYLSWENQSVAVLAVKFFGVAKTRVAGQG